MIGDLRATTVQKQMRRRGDRHHIAQAELFTTPAKLVVRTVHFIGRHPFRRNLSRHRPLQHLSGQLRLRGELDFVRNVRFPTALSIVDPGLGQVQLPVDQRVTF